MADAGAHAALLRPARGAVGVAEPLVPARREHRRARPSAGAGARRLRAGAVDHLDPRRDRRRSHHDVHGLRAQPHRDGELPPAQRVPHGRRGRAGAALLRAAARRSRVRRPARPLRREGLDRAADAVVLHPDAGDVLPAQPLPGAAPRREAQRRREPRHARPRRPRARPRARDDPPRTRRPRVGRAGDHAAARARDVAHAPLRPARDARARRRPRRGDGLRRRAVPLHDAALVRRRDDLRDDARDGTTS